MPSLFDEVPWWTTADMNNALARENRPKPRGFRLNSADRINAEYGPLVYDDQSATAFATDQSQKLLEQRGQPGVLSKLLIGGAANAMEAAGVPGVFDPDGTVRGQTWSNALRASSWIPQDTIEGVGQAITAPSRAYRGEIPDEDMISEGLNFAGNMAMTGSIAPKPSNAAGMFGGRLAKTADHAKLKTAEEMAAKGAPREDIWSQTGWFKSPDGHWKFEIDDSKAGFLVPPKRTSDRTDRVHHRNVSDVFSHPDLYAAYPDAANASLVMRGSPGGSYYDPIKFGLEKPRIEVYNKEFSTMKPDSILLHELQHGVQYNEGFAKGGSLQSVGEDPALRTAQAEASSQRKTTDQLLNDWMIAPRDGKDAAWAAYQAGKDAELAAKNKARDVAAALPSPDEYYRRLAGEAEARAVQTRQHLTSEQRAARPPWMDFDVPEADQIALYGNGKSSGVPGVLLSQAGDQAPRVANPIRAYHGSPHDFDRFDLSKIGTGEGAQAYGHGLYFAEREGVARSYRDALGGQKLSDGSKFDDANPAHQAAAYVAGTSSKEEAIKALVDDIAMSRRKYDEAHAQRLMRAKGMLERGEPIPTIGNGKMYEVNIHASPDDFLDWDRPLSQQSEKVRKAVEAEQRRYYGSQYDGQAPLYADKPANEALQAINMRNAVPDYLADHFRNSGVPGIKYLDQGSRTAGEGSRNYVVFDQDLIDILRKYMNPQTAAAPGVLMVEGAKDGRRQ